MPPILNPTNGKYYEVVIDRFISPEAAVSAASTRTFNGLPGHIVTIDSESENYFVKNLINNTDSSKPNEHPWWIWIIGASDTQNEQIWQWLDGPEKGKILSYKNFYFDEGLDHSEDYVAMTPTTGLWNDIPNESYSGVGGYIVEYESVSDLYITTFGSAWNGGYSINSITQGDDGWTYLAGGKSVGLNNQDPVVLAYQDGVLMWEKTFGGPKPGEEFRSVYVRDGYVYAAGGIREGFNPTTHDNQQFPAEKLPNIIEPDLNCAPFVVKLDSFSGELKVARVLSAETNDNNVLSSVVADSEGNFYVNGGPTTGENFNKRKLTKYDPSGNLVWTDGGQLGGGGLLKQDLADSIWLSKGADWVMKVSPTGQILESIDPPRIEYFGSNVQFYTADFVIDSTGNLYFVATKDDFSKHTTGGAWHQGQSTVVAKVEPNGFTGDYVWISEFIGGNNGPSSIGFTPDGKLIVAGVTNGDLNGAPSKGQIRADNLFDGYLVTLDPESGEIQETSIIGTDANEWLSQAIVTSDGKILISGEFSSKYYSIEGTKYQNIYLISKDGFALMGNDFDNEIQGGDGNDSINSGLGDDLLNGGLGNDILDGGQGVDIVSYETSKNAIVINLQSGSASGIDIGNDSIKNIEEAWGGAGADVITANNLGSRLRGGAGNDKLVGGMSTDVFYGGIGNDELNGGSGDDLANYADVIANLNISLLTGVVVGDGTDALISIEDVVSGVGDDIIYGNAASNEIESSSGDDWVDAGGGDDLIVGGHGEGDDTYIGGIGIDTIKYKSALSGIEVKLGLSQGYAKSIDLNDAAGIGNDKLSQIENVIGGDFSDIIIGNADPNALDGGSGADFLDGGGGADRMIGGIGNDVYVLDQRGDKVIERAGEGIDTIQTASTSLGSFSLNIRSSPASYRSKSVSLASFSNVENLTYTGTGNAELIGNSLSNVINGSSGNDLLNGGSGADVLNGGLGNDIYVVDNVNDIVTEAADEGTDTIQSGVTLRLADNVENLTLTGRSAINGTGNDDGNRMLGNTAQNTLNGGLGDDTLDGGAGNDVLLGGGGDDYVIGGNGIDVLTGGDGADRFLFDKLIGRTNIDTITDFESGIDKILLDDAIFKKLIGDSDFSDNFFIRSIVGPASAQDQNDFIVFDLESSKLYYDADGSGQRSVPVLFATLTGVSELSHNDFWIV